MAWHHIFSEETPSPESVDFTGMNFVYGIGTDIPTNVTLRGVIPNIATSGAAWFTQVPNAPYKISETETHFLFFTTNRGEYFVEFSYNSTNQRFESKGTSYGNNTLYGDLEWWIYMSENTPTDVDITQTYTNCHSDFSSLTVPQYSELTINIYPDTGYDLISVPTCTMGTTVIEPIAIEGGYRIHILQVTSAVTISASGSELNNANFGFINIYNPTLFELQQAAERWFYSLSSTGYVDLSNYIVSLFITYGKPIVMTNTESIKFSNYDTTIQTHIVKEPIIDIDCGSININEFYNNALDYSPNTSIRIFLPFIGYEDLDTNIVMNHNISLKYRIDSLTGKCIAKISYIENNIKYDLYTFTGDCSMQIPFYFNDGNTINTSLVNQPFNLDDKTPFVLIERATSYMPDSSQLDAPLSNELVVLGDVNGYTVCKEVNVYGINCTSIEKDEIETILKRGVIL